MAEGERGRQDRAWPPGGVREGSGGGRGRTHGHSGAVLPGSSESHGMSPVCVLAEGWVTGALRHWIQGKGAGAWSARENVGKRSSRGSSSQDPGVASSPAFLNPQDSS